MKYEVAEQPEIELCVDHRFPARPTIETVNKTV